MIRCHIESIYSLTSKTVGFQLTERNEQIVNKSTMDNLIESEPRKESVLSMADNLEG